MSDDKELAEVVIEEGVSSDISGDDSIAYKSWKEFEEAVVDGREVIPEYSKAVEKNMRYEFNVDEALDCIDLTFNGYTPSQDALEFYALMRLVNGEDFEVDNSLTHYFLVDLVFGNIKRENFPYSEEINSKIRLNSKKIAIIAARFTAKALTLDSKIVTPKGFTTMGEVKVGDVVLDRNGKKCNVIAKSPVFNKPVYKMTLADGRVVKMSDDHDNIVWKRKRRLVAGENRCKNSSPAGYIETVMTAKELYEAGVTTNRTPKNEGWSDRDYKYWIPNPGDLEFEPEYDQSDFGFDPYTTGVILGDGHVSDNGYTRITAHKDDMYEYDRNIPYEFGKVTKKYIDGVEQDAVMFGLLYHSKSIKKWIGTERSYTKRVPEGLLHGSYYQRLEVLKGLMDTDGTVDKQGFCSFTSVSIGLAEDVKELVQSLGGSAYIHEAETPSPFGKAYTVNIRINKVIFKLKRKVSRQKVCTTYMRTAIKSIELIESEPTQCIAVDSDTKSFLTDGYTVTHNSTVITAFMPIYCAITGKLPGFGDVMFWVSFGDSQQAGAKVQANTIRDICSDSEFCKQYFEKMRFTDEECEFIRKGDEPIKKRAFMFKVKGAAGGSVRGIRYKTERPQILSFDDIIKNESDANSVVIMNKLKSMIYSDAENALGRKGKIIIVNTPFNKKDPVYSALESGVWTPICIPLCEKIELGMRKEDYRGSWEEMKPFEEIMEKYEDAHYNNTLREFNQELMLRISSEEDRLVTDEMMNNFWYSRKQLGQYLDGYNIVVTTDFTASNELKGDFSGIAVWAVNSNRDWFMLDLMLEKTTIEGQYDKLLSMVQYWTHTTGKHLEVGIETDGQQRLNISALKDKQLAKNVWFKFARQIGDTPTGQGISRKRAGGDKHSQFMRAHNVFMNGKIYFPEELRDTPSMKELMSELKYITYTAITSKNDDGLDLVSMTALMDITYPTVEASGYSGDSDYGEARGIYGNYFTGDKGNSGSSKSTVF